jgi:8-oxo-dGTP pyrophosphatase MutT (NUDIX family)
MKIATFFYAFVTKIIKKVQIYLRANTIGSRAIVINADGQILLVKHTYQPHWYLPGGGVKKGESAKAALIRELNEEVGLLVNLEEPVLFGIYHHIYMGLNDYPIIYIVKNYNMTSSNSGEIEEIAWFDYDELPAMVSPGTKRRLMEYFTRSVAADKW